MMIELTPQQRQELNKARADEIRVRDPDTQQEYVLLPAEVYDRIKTILFADDETLISTAYPLLDEMAAKAGWDDPALDVYNDLIPKDRQ